VRVVIVHGTDGSPESNWLPWLANQVEAAGHTALRPAMLTPEGQNLTNWRKAFAKQVGPLAGDLVLVGHSMAPALLFRLLERADQPVAGTFSVACFIHQLGIDYFDPLSESFFTDPFDWPAIERNAGKTYVYHSEDDPYVPISHSEEVAEHLGAPLRRLADAKHINREAGFGPFPQLWADLAPLLDRESQAR